MGKRRSYELHHFADASTFGYGKFSYLRIRDENNQVNVALVIGESREAPTKIATIPRLVGINSCVGLSKGGNEDPRRVMLSQSNGVILD